jgi:hypothetical protein
MDHGSGIHAASLCFASAKAVLLPRFQGTNPDCLRRLNVDLAYFQAR